MQTNRVVCPCNEASGMSSGRSMVAIRWGARPRLFQTVGI